MYFPIINHKRNELKALEQLSDDMKKAVCPVFLQQGEQCELEYSDECYIFHPIMKKEGQKAVFIYQTGDLEQIDKNEEKIGIFINREQFTNQELIKRISYLKNKEIALFLDFGDLSGIDDFIFSILPGSIPPEIVKLKNVSLIIFSATSAPKSMALVSKGISRIPRRELILYKSLMEKFNIPLNFGDYGTRNPESATEYEIYMKPGAKIRYTLKDEFLILKGDSLRTGRGFDQFIDLSSNLIKMPEFMGEEFSWGDKMIALTANGNHGTGNLGTWVGYELSHHIAITVKQTSS